MGDKLPRIVGHVYEATDSFMGHVTATERRKLWLYSAKEWNTQLPIPPCESENYKVIKNKLKKDKRIQLSSKAMVKFDGPLEFTVLLDKSSCWHDVWMSDTPMEVKTASAAIHKARGNVLVAGLGLGYVVYHMAKKKSVTSITVIEKDREIIKLIWPHLRKHIGHKVKVIQADIYEWKPGKQRFDYAWFDIWKTPDDFSYNHAAPVLVELFRKNCSPDKMGFWSQYLCREFSLADVLTQLKAGRSYVKDRKKQGF